MKIHADSSRFWFAVTSSDYLCDSVVWETSCTGNAVRRRTLHAPAGIGMGLIITGFNWHTHKHWQSVPAINWHFKRCSVFPVFENSITSDLMFGVCLSFSEPFS